MIGKAQKSHGARSELKSVFGLEKVDWLNPNRTSTIQSRSCPLQIYYFIEALTETWSKQDKYSFVNMILNYSKYSEFWYYSFPTGDMYFCMF